VLHAVGGFGVAAAQRAFQGGVEIGLLGGDAGQLRDVAPDNDPEGREQLARHRPGGHARGGLPPR